MSYYYWKKVVGKIVKSVLLSVGILSLFNLKAVQAEEMLRIGVLQYVEHESLNQNYEGFIQGLTDAGYVEGENLTIDFLNASGDTANLQSMSESLANNNDYLFTIATPAAQAVANIEKEKPLYISAVSDPVSAGLVNSFENTGTNVTGTIDAGPLKEQILLIESVAPEAEMIGILYNSGEANAVSEASTARDIMEEVGYQVTEATITSTNDISQVLSNLVENVDVVFIVTDNTVASAMALVGDLTTEAGVPLVGGSKDMVLENGLITYGLDYFKLGEQTARMLVRQVEEDIDTQAMPIENAEDLELVINEDNAEKLGIDPSTIQLTEKN